MIDSFLDSWLISFHLHQTQRIEESVKELISPSEVTSMSPPYFRPARAVAEGGSGVVSCRTGGFRPALVSPAASSVGALA